MSDLTDKEKDAVLIVCVYVLLFPIFVIYIVLSIGFVLSCLWGWFVVPLGVLPITTLHAYGLSGIVALVTYRPSIHKDDKNEVDRRKVAGIMFVPWISLLVGYFVHLFV